MDNEVGRSVSPVGAKLSGKPMQHYLVRGFPGLE
jgi:hypothetical protein